MIASLIIAASVSVSQVEMPTYPFSDPDPVPCTAERRYPYFRFDGSSHVAVTQKWLCVTLENERIRVTMLPEIGGKVWGAVDKATGREFIYFNHVVKFRNIAMRGPWCSGGVEFNFGIIGHSPTTATPVDWCVRTNADGSASCFVSATEWINRTTWQVEVNVPPDADHFLTRTLWFNGANLPGPYYQWMTGSCSARGNPELLFPGSHYIGHEGDAHPWPVDARGRDLSRYANNAFGESKSYHVVNGDHSRFAVWWPEAKFGMYHVSEEKFGRKIWIWALSREGGIWEDMLTDTDGQYIEIQSGRAFNQPRFKTYLTPFKHPTFAAGATDAFEDEWGVLRSREDASRSFSSSNFVERPLSMPSYFDWNSPYGRYVRGEQALRERDDRTGEQALVECLRKEPCFAPALNELAGLMARRGDYGRVRELCARALSVNTYDPEANYLDGFAADAMGAEPTARERLRLAAYSPEWRVPALARLAKMAIRNGSWREADELAVNALRANDRNLDAWMARIAAARRSGDACSARTLANRILREFPLFHGARFELKLLGDVDVDGFRSLVRNEMPGQTYMELGTWYEDAGLDDEAKELFGYADGPVAKIRLASVLSRAGDIEGANVALGAAASMPVEFALPFRRETLATLRWAASAHSSWKFRYLLAVQLAAFAHDGEADRLLDTCDEADEAVVFHYRALRRTGKARLADLLRAQKISDGWRIGRDLAAYHLDAGDAGLALSATREYLMRFSGCNQLEFLHARALCSLGREEDAVAFLRNIRVLPSEFGDDAHGIWQTAWEGIARRARATGDEAKANDALVHSREYPENLGRGQPYHDSGENRRE